MIAKPFALVLALVGAPVFAQGFAGLGSAAEEFALPVPNVPFTFPRDHGPHKDFRIEWWYVTASLSGADGRDYGLQWTLFRTALGLGTESGWSSPQVWMGHAALTSPNAHFAAEKMARGGIGQAGVTAVPFDAWIDDWRMAGDSLDALHLSANGNEWGYEVMLDAQGPLVAHGDNGFSVKAPTGQASYYYSQPFFSASGILTLPDGHVAVTGDAWLDREWSSQPLAEDQTGWDWFSLGFEDGDKLMAFRLRDGAGGFRSGTWITATGEAFPLGDSDIVATPLEHEDVQGRQVPVRWRLQVPSRSLDVEVTAMNPQSWMGLSISYWEGPVYARGSHAGRGYLEMTGYE